MWGRIEDDKDKEFELNEKIEKLESSLEHYRGKYMAWKTVILLARDYGIISKEQYVQLKKGYETYLNPDDAR